MQWVTRQRPKIDRIACPWLISRFIDPDPEFLFVPPGEVRGVARATGAIPFDVPGVELFHPRNGCSFDVFLVKYRLDDPALACVASIVRAADNDNMALAPEAAGLRAISLGMAGSIRDDQSRVTHGLVLYDALYHWARNVSANVKFERPERGLALWLARHRERRALAELDDRMQHDIGVTRADIKMEYAKPFWRP